MSLRPGASFASEAAISGIRSVLGERKTEIATGLQDKPLAVIKPLGAAKERLPRPLPGPRNDEEERGLAMTTQGKGGLLPTVIATKGAFCPDEAISGTKKRDCHGSQNEPRNDKKRERSQ